MINTLSKINLSKIGWEGGGQPQFTQLTLYREALAQKDFSLNCLLVNSKSAHETLAIACIIVAKGYPTPHSEKL